MRRVFLLMLLVVGLGVLMVNGIKQKVKHDLAQPVISTVVTPAQKQDTTKRILATENDTTSLFVPYWTLNNPDFSGEAYDAYLYFGITPTQNGINTNENGYTRIAQFIAAVPEDKKKLLVLRMLDSDNNTAILRSSTKQDAVISETITAAQANGFDGIVLDLELSAIPFESLVTQISKFNETFYTQTKKTNLTYGIAIYGDVFYRLRPFDVKAIAQKTDTIYVMAYDFHKSRGKPGPNFPLLGKETYGYDIAQMSDDFLRYAPSEKVTITFGLFGYDWEIDAKGNPTEQGKALSYNEISARFINGCSEANCNINRESSSMETQIMYTDTLNKLHEVWFEDSRSVEAKQAYLRGKGITNFSFWAYSYF